MNLKKQKTNAIISVFVIFSILSGVLQFQGQDLVGYEDLSSGSSVFVFRQSKFKPQFKSSSHNYFLRNISGREINTQNKPVNKTKLNHIRKNSSEKNNSAGMENNKAKKNNTIAPKNNLSNSLTDKANLLLKNKLTDQAIVTFQEALNTNPQNLDAKLGLGKSYAVQGDISKAEDYLSKAEKVGGITSKTEFLSGLINLKQNKNDSALADISKSISHDSKNSEAFFYQAETYDRLNLSQNAINAYRKTVELDPKFTEAWFDLAVLNYNKGDFKEAISIYKQVISLDKNHPDAHANIASSYRQLEQYTDANSEYKIAAEYIKDDPDLFSEWGYCLGKVAEWGKAIAKLQTAKDLNPNSIDYTNLGWAYFNAAQKDMDNRNNTDAQTKLNLGKEVLQKAVELDPKFDAAYLNLGVTYAKLGDFQNAVNNLNKANNLRQKWILGINELGMTYRNFKKYSEAINQFQKVIYLDEKFAPGYFNLGEAQFKSGKKKDADNTLEKLKQLNPNLAQKLESIINSKVIKANT